MSDKDTLNQQLRRLTAKNRRRQSRALVKKNQERFYAQQASSAGTKRATNAKGVKSLEAKTDGANEVTLNDAAVELNTDTAIFTGSKDPTTITLPYSGATTDLNFDSGGASLDSAFSPSAVIVGGTTDTTVSGALQSLTGQDDIVEKKSLKAVGGSGPNSVLKNAEGIKNKANSLKDKISDGLSGIASALELDQLSSVKDQYSTSNVKDVIESLTPVASLKTTKDPSNLLSNVTNQTGLASFQGIVTSVKSVLTSIPTLDDLLGKSNFANNGLTDIVNQVNQVKDKLDKFKNGAIGDVEQGLDGFLQNTMERETGKAKGQLNGLIDNKAVTFNETEQKEILGLATKTVGNGKKDKQALAEATTKSAKKLTPKPEGLEQSTIDIMRDLKGENLGELTRDFEKKAKQRNISSKQIGMGIAELERLYAGLEKIDTTIAGSVIADDSYFDEPTRLNTYTKEWKGRNTKDENFAYVETVEELNAEFSKITRVITEVIIHASETATDKNIGAVELNNIAKKLDKGGDGIQYNYVIRRDGRLQRGRPVNIAGEHTTNKTRNKTSISVVLVGGINAATGVDNPLAYLSAQSFTRAQYTTLEQLLTSFYHRYPGGQVFGHNEVDDTEQDPYFDVNEYVNTLFRKYNTVSTYGVRSNPANTVITEPRSFNTRDAATLSKHPDLTSDYGDRGVFDETNINAHQAKYGFEGVSVTEDRNESNTQPDELEELGFELTKEELEARGIYTSDLDVDEDDWS